MPISATAKMGRQRNPVGRRILADRRRGRGHNPGSRCDADAHPSLLALHGPAAASPLPAQAATTSTAADRDATKKELQRYTVAIGTLAFDASGELRATEQLEFRLLRVCPNGTIVQPPKPCPK